MSQGHSVSERDALLLHLVTQPERVNLFYHSHDSFVLAAVHVSLTQCRHV